MSIGIGTLRPKTRIVRPAWIAGLVAIILAFTVAVIVTNSGDEPAREATGTQAAVSGTAANTPSELRAATTVVDETTLANTPSEVRPHVPRRAANAETVSGSFGNTPSELSGGLSAIERYARHQLR
jgi:hypothetical protein